MLQFLSYLFYVPWSMYKVKITTAHYDFYAQHKIKKLGNYAPKHLISVHTLINPPFTYDTSDKHNDMVLLKMLVKNNDKWTLVSKLGAIVKSVGVSKNRKRLFAKVLSKIK